MPCLGTALLHTPKPCQHMRLCGLQRSNAQCTKSVQRHASNRTNAPVKSAQIPPATPPYAVAATSGCGLPPHTPALQHCPQCKTPYSPLLLLLLLWVLPSQPSTAAAAGAAGPAPLLLLLCRQWQRIQDHNVHQHLHRLAHPSSDCSIAKCPYSPTAAAAGAAVPTLYCCCAGRGSSFRMRSETKLSTNRCSTFLTPASIAPK